MSYLTMKIPTNTTEITLKDDKGGVHKIDVTATLNSKLGPNSIGRSVIRLDGQLMTNTIELEESKYPNDLLNDTDIEKILPKIDDIRKEIEKNTTTIAKADPELDGLGLPSIEQLRKLL